MTNAPMRTPTVAEWYGASYTPSFPDDDGEEMRRVSSLVPVSADEYASLLTARDNIMAAAKRVLAWAAPIAGDNRDEVAGLEEEQSVEALLAAISQIEGSAS